MKYLLEWCLTAVLLCLSIPLFFAISLIIWMTVQENPFYISIRSGYKGAPFKIYKFKTLRTAVDDKGVMLPDSQRITKIGNILRASSVDELPQLLNILQNKMRLVGPRPLDEDFFSKYDAEQVKRLDVKPGITGWAQVNGRNNLTWEQKFEYDIYYVNHQSFWLDIKILLLTVKIVFNHEGISQNGFINAESFKGKN